MSEQVEYSMVTVTVNGSLPLTPGVSSFIARREPTGVEDYKINFLIEVTGKDEEDARAKLVAFREALAEAIKP